VRDFGFLHCVIVGYIVEVSDEVAASIFKVGEAKVCRLYVHGFRRTHFTVYGASVTQLCYFSVFSVVLRPVSGLRSPITGLRHHAQLDTPHSVGRLWTSDQFDAEASDNTTLNKRQTSKPPAGFEPTIPPSERPQTYPLGCADTGIGNFSVLSKLIEGLRRTSPHSWFVSHIAFPTPLWLLASTCNLNTSSPHAFRP